MQCPFKKILLQIGFTPEQEYLRRRPVFFACLVFVQIFNFSKERLNNNMQLIPI